MRVVGNEGQGVRNRELDLTGYIFVSVGKEDPGTRILMRLGHFQGRVRERHDSLRRRCIVVRSTLTSALDCFLTCHGPRLRKNDAVGVVKVDDAFSSKFQVLDLIFSHRNLCSSAHHELSCHSLENGHVPVDQYICRLQHRVGEQAKFELPFGVGV